MILPISVIGTPELRRLAQPVVTIDAELRRLIEDMWETLNANEAIGLAANQVNVLQRIILIGLGGYRVAMLNPAILEQSKTTDAVYEGCLSFPGLSLKIERSLTAVVEWTTLHGNRITQGFSGDVARVIQHEIDHLDGILFTDHAIHPTLPAPAHPYDEWLQ